MNNQKNTKGEIEFANEERKHYERKSFIELLFVLFIVFWFFLALTGHIQVPDSQTTHCTQSK